MQALQLQRRKVLLAISQLALVVTLPACSDTAEQAAVATSAAITADSDLELLASVVYDLFPYPALTAELYVRSAEHLLQSNNPAITAGLTQLRAESGNLPWKEVDEPMRIAILTSLQTSAFFAAVRAGALEVLYRSPEVFDLVGYGGSAIEQGGYINRGFADINWLPQE